MTLVQLFTFLNENTSNRYFESENELAVAMQGEHANPLIAKMVKMIAEKCACEDIECQLKREDVVNALGPLRLEYMKDDAPVEGFRLLEGTITAIDLAFNDEALKAKQ